MSEINKISDSQKVKELDKKIKEGRIIYSRQINNQSDFDEVYQSYENWWNSNQIFLTDYFEKDIKELYPTWTSSDLIIGAIPSQLNNRVDNIRSDINKEIQYLITLKNNKELTMKPKWKKFSLALSFLVGISTIIYYWNSIFNINHNSNPNNINKTISIESSYNIQGNKNQIGNNNNQIDNIIINQTPLVPIKKEKKTFKLIPFGDNELKDLIQKKIGIKFDPTNKESITIKITFDNDKLKEINNTNTFLFAGGPLIIRINEDDIKIQEIQLTAYNIKPGNDKDKLVSAINNEIERILKDDVNKSIIVERIKKYLK